MRISKIMVALLVSVVALTGVAVADDINVFEPGTFAPGVGGSGGGTAVANIQLVPGGAAVTKDLVVWSFNQPANTLHTLNTSVAPLTPGGLAGDIVVKYSERTVPCAVPPGCGVFTPALRNWIQNMGAQSSAPAATVWEIHDVQFAAVAGVTAGNQYQVQIEDNNGLPLTVQVTLITTTIPEFATIAIPAIAVLGLFLFFNRRKHKKD